MLDTYFNMKFSEANDRLVRIEDKVDALDKLIREIFQDKILELAEMVDQKSKDKDCLEYTMKKLLVVAPNSKVKTKDVIRIFQEVDETKAQVEFIEDYLKRNYKLHYSYVIGHEIDQLFVEKQKLKDSDIL